jgi:hypothetical protein
MGRWWKSWVGGGRREAHVGALAGAAGDAGLIGGRSKLSTMRVHPSKHVGEQIAGAGGWRACCGSGGSFGPSITTGGERSGTLEHAATSSSGSSSMVAHACREAFGFIDALQVGGGQAPLFDAGLALGVARDLLSVGGLLVPRALGLGKLGLRAVHAQRLHADRAGHRQAQDAGGWPKPRRRDQRERVHPLQLPGRKR